MAKTENRTSKGQGTKPSPRPSSPAAAAAPGPPASSLSLLLRWFTSGTYRHATAMRKHVQKLLNHQRDILPPQAVAALQSAIHDLRTTQAAASPKAVLEKQMERLENAANNLLKAYPN